ncbi:MAG: MFS transporter [Anaerococcus sp.]|nr:MFS transporter [Anaerococcus sp.]
MKKLTSYNLKDFAILSLALLLASNAAISGTLPFMKTSLGISMEASEFLITLSSIATVLAISLSEFITRRLGIKKTVELGLSLVFISSLTPLIKTTYPSIFLSRIILGLGLGLFNGHSANYISALYDGKKLYRLLGLRNAMEFVGQVLLLILAGFLIKISWVYGFLSYSLAFFILLLFRSRVPDIRIEKEEGRFRINKQVLFYVSFAGLMIMNVNAIVVRLPSLVSQSLGLSSNINAIMVLLPLAGMVAGILFARINKILGAKTPLLGLILYMLANLGMGLLGHRLWIFIGFMVLVAFSQSLCFPYLFAEVSRFSRGSANRIINNLIFIACNIGGFLSPFFLRAFSFIKEDSLTGAFLVFPIIYLGFFLVMLAEYLRVK